MSGLRLPGSLAVSLQALSAVGSSLDVAVQYAVETLERTKADGSASFTNFIQAEVDLNSKITYSGDAATKDGDDAYALAAISVASTSAKNVVLSLPSAQNVLIDAGEIDAQDPNGVSLGKFPVTLTVSCNDQGLMSSSIAISGQDVAATASDDPNLAQKSYWTGAQSVPSVAADDADELENKLTAAELTTYYATELSTINDQYNGANMIKSWTITVNEIPSSTGNVLAQHVRFLGKKGTTSVFANDEKMVAATPFSYGVSIDDYLGNAQTVVAAANVFGVLSHKSA